MLRTYPDIDTGANVTQWIEAVSTAVAAMAAASTAFTSVRATRSGKHRSGKRPDGEAGGLDQ